jgi:hypothetical protein
MLAPIFPNPREEGGLGLSSDGPASIVLLSLILSIYEPHHPWGRGSCRIKHSHFTVNWVEAQSTIISFDLIFELGL